MIKKWEAMCDDLGLEINHDKSMSGTRVKYLGIFIDTVEMIARLPEKKLKLYINQIKNLVKSTGQNCSLEELGNLTGRLCHAACVFPAGRTWLRRLYNLQTKFRMVPKHQRKSRMIRLSRPSEPRLDAKRDFRFWLDHLPYHKGVGIITDLAPTTDAQLGLAHSSFKASSDASGTLGAVVYAPPGSKITRWFKRKWTATELKLNIATRELICVMWAVWLFGSEWEGKRIRIYCDNEEW
jgi:hypothetical protein